MTTIANNKTELPKENELVIKELLDIKSNQLLPLIIRPKDSKLSIVDWMKTNKEEFEAELLKYGGILFRGWEINNVEDFSDFTKCFNTDPLPYMFRSSPRKELDHSIKNIYTSTIYPNERTINMHNESSYSRVWGRKIVFCCLVPAEEGGETPIADSRRVLNDINPSLVEKFRVKGVKYRRNLFPDLGMPWQEVFQTDDMNVARGICQKNDIEFNAIDKGQVVIEWNKPAIYKHPISGAETWFNHVLFFNKYSRYEELGLEPDDHLPSEYLTSETFFGDGSEISYDEYLIIKEAYRKNNIVFKYQKGDILFLDNMLSAHGRNSFKGERTIATAILEASFD